MRWRPRLTNRNLPSPRMVGAARISRIKARAGRRICELYGEIEPARGASGTSGRNAAAVASVGSMRGAIRLSLTQPRSLLPALPQKGRGLRFDHDRMPEQLNGTPGKKPPAPSVKVRIGAVARDAS